MGRLEEHKVLPLSCIGGSVLQNILRCNYKKLFIIPSPLARMCQAQVIVKCFLHTHYTPLEAPKAEQEKLSVLTMLINTSHR